MKKILLPLLLSLSSLFGDSIVGTWTVDEKNTKASLKSSLSAGNELVFIERFILHAMKSLQCSHDHTCLIQELHNSNPHTGKYTWKTKDETYLLEGNHKQLRIVLIDNTTIKMVASDISAKKLEIYYTKNEDTAPSILKKPTHKITPLKTIEATQKVIHTITSVEKSMHSTKIYTHKIQSIPKQKLQIDKEPIVNINIEAEKVEKKHKLAQEYLQATMDVM